MSSDSCACAKGHQFAYLAAPQSFACAHCGQNVPTGKSFYGCGECDRDICVTCYADPEARNSKEAPGAAAAVVQASKDKASVPASEERMTAKTSVSTQCSGRRCGMSFLEVFTPIAPHPPSEDVSIETTTTFRIPDVDISIDESEECEPGMHSFSRYAASNSLCCHRCNEQVRPGRYVHSCEECDIDLCETCFASEDEEQMSSLGSMASLTKTVAQLYLAGTREPRSTELPFNLAKLEPSGAKGLHVTGSICLESSSTVAPADSGASTPLSCCRSHSIKECLSCEKSYSGFGAQCGECRKSGPSVRQCTECQNYFIGFGTACEECRHVPSCEAFAERAGMTFSIAPPCN